MTMMMIHKKIGGLQRDQHQQKFPRSFLFSNTIKNVRKFTHVTRKFSQSLPTIKEMKLKFFSNFIFPIFIRNRVGLAGGFIAFIIKKLILHIINRR